ncbi:hypothetical protein EON62_01400 [archaeon]|nr:MAG: hypothetical protein EON62_01400 [archaeon]
MWLVASGVEEGVRVTVVCLYPLACCVAVLDASRAPEAVAAGAATTTADAGPATMDADEAF